MNLSPTLQRQSSLRRTTSSIRSQRRRTNWTLIVIILTVLHLSATFLYYAFLAGKAGSGESGATAKKATVNYESEVILLRERLAKSQETLHELRLAQKRLLTSQTGHRKGHQDIQLAFPLGQTGSETETNNVLPDRTRGPLEPLVSVIISAWKQGDVIAGAIQSVFAQTYSHWELIIVDDNSKDETGDRCRELLRSHTRHPISFTRKASSGIADGLNRGLQLARGDWIVALDPRDRLAPEYFADVANGDAADPRAQVFLGCMESDHRTWCFPDGWSLSGLVLPSTLPLGFAVRRDLVSDVGGFDPACPEYMLPWNFWLSTIRYRPKVRFLPSVVLFHASKSSHVSQGETRQVSQVERDEAAAMVRTLHPDVFEPSQLLTDHELIASLSTESLTGMLARGYQFPSHPMLPFWKALYWEAQGEHDEAADLMMTSLRAAQDDTHFEDRWQQHFWLALFEEENDSLVTALMHARLALTFNHFDELLRTVWRLEGAVRAAARAVPYYWSNEEEVERIRKLSLAGKLARLAELQEALPRARRKHVELMSLLTSVQQHPCDGRQAPRGSLNLVRNPHFKGRADWYNYGLGFDIDPAQGRAAAPEDGPPALKIQSFRLEEQRGAMQTVKVDQQEAGPILISAWHMTKDVVGAGGSGFGLQLEVHYRNGSSVLEPPIHFTPGTHDWADVSTVVSSSGHVASIDVSILFAQHSGELWVDNVSVAEVRKVACQCPPGTFYDPTPAQDCSPCPVGSLCIHGLKVDEQLDLPDL